MYPTDPLDGLSSDDILSKTISGDNSIFDNFKLACLPEVITKVIRQSGTDLTLHIDLSTPSEQMLNEVLYLYYRAKSDLDSLDDDTNEIKSFEALRKLRQQRIQGKSGEMNARSKYRNITKPLIRAIGLWIYDYATLSRTTTTDAIKSLRNKYTEIDADDPTIRKYYNLTDETISTGILKKFS